MPSDPELRSHQEWLGMVQPVGLVASARALAAAGAFIDPAGLIAPQQKFEALTEQTRDEDPTLPDLAAFCLQVLGGRPILGALHMLLCIERLFSRRAYACRRFYAKAASSRMTSPPRWPSRCSK